MQVDVSTRPAHARRGAVLVLVLFVIVLASALAVLATRYSVELARTTRHHHEAILLQQMTDSAEAWLIARRAEAPPTSVRLDAAGILPDGMSGQVTISPGTDRADTVTVELAPARGRREGTRRETVIIRP